MRATPQFGYVTSIQLVLTEDKVASATVSSPDDQPTTEGDTLLQ